MWKLCFMNFADYLDHLKTMDSPDVRIQTMEGRSIGNNMITIITTARSKDGFTLVVFEKMIAHGIPMDELDATRQKALDTKKEWTDSIVALGLTPRVGIWEI